MVGKITKKMKKNKTKDTRDEKKNDMR